jgi:hypothetical protein
VEDIHLNCKRFLEHAPLSTPNLPHYMELACTFGINTAVQRCKDYIAAGDNLKDLAR